MKRVIMVEPEMLISISNKILDDISNYDHLCDLLFSQIDKMQDNWKGKDNIAYTSQIKKYRDDMLKTSFLLKQYAGFLKSSANSYSETQDELYNSAMRLYK